MKFMKRTAVKAELEEVDDEKKRNENEEHWELDIPELPKAESKYITESSYNVLENLQYGRMSFKGFNPEIESIMRGENVMIELDEADRREKETAVSDEEMSERYKWLVSNMGKKFVTKRQRAEMESSDDDEEDDIPASQPKQTKKDSNSHPDRSSNAKTDGAKYNNRKVNSQFNVPKQMGSRSLINKMPRDAATKCVPPYSDKFDVDTHIPIGTRTEPATNVYNPKPKEQTAKKRRSGPVMDSDEEDDGETRRQRRKQKFMKPKD